MPFFIHQGTQLHFQETGRGQPVLLLHGLGSCGEDWSRQAAFLQARYRVITLDFRGHGQSDVAPGPYSVAQFADDSFALLDYLQLQQVHLVGLSLGGMVALEMATRQPACLASLTVLNSTPHMLLDRFALRSAYWFRLAVIRLLGLPRLGKIIGKKLFPNDNQQSLRDLFNQRLSSMDSDAYINTIKAICQWSVLDKLNRVQIPTLVASADNDYTSLEEKQRYTALIPDAQFKVISDSRHATPLDQPEKLNRVLADFFYECGKTLNTNEK